MQPSGVEAYTLGRTYSVMPIPMDPEHCVEVPAGPVLFVVEARSLTEKSIIENQDAQGTSDGIESFGDIQDGGASLHVLDAETRQEHLRFDAFDNEPHYHYIRNRSKVNIVVRLDSIAEGDPLQWTLERMRTRLPEMLAHAEGDDLAQRVREAGSEVQEACGRLEELLITAENRSAALRS